METIRIATLPRLLGVAVLVACSACAELTYARDNKRGVSTDDPTYRLFRLLDNSNGGKLSDFCIVADTYSDARQPGQMLQHVLRIDYDKNRFFGRFRIYVRGVSQLTPGELKEYTPEQIYGFGSDIEKFEKIDPGPFGETGDVYFRAAPNSPLTPAPVTDDAKREYEFFLTQYVLPALEKSNP